MRVFTTCFIFTLHIFGITKVRRCDLREHPSPRGPGCSLHPHVGKYLPPSCLCLVSEAFCCWRRTCYSSCRYTRLEAQFACHLKHTKPVISEVLLSPSCIFQGRIEEMMGGDMKSGVLLTLWSSILYKRRCTFVTLFLFFRKIIQGKREFS